jgi:hypothetical protein
VDLTQVPRPRLEPELRDLITIIRPKEIIEFGSWEGRSATAFLQFAKEINLTTKILCVDTWLGSSEHWSDKLSGSEWGIDHLRIEAGQPQILDTFWRTIETFGLSNQVSILRCLTENSGPYLKKFHRSANLIYIDAAHDFQSVHSDLRVAERSFSFIHISGDDFHWPEVRIAILLFAFRRNYQVLVGANKTTWLIITKEMATIEEMFVRSGWRKIKRLRVLIKTLNVVARSRLKYLIKTRPKRP